jgi:hypothetical protein
MTLTGSGHSSVNKARGPTFRRSAIEKSRFALARIFIARAISSNGSSTRSSNVGVSRPDTTNSRPTILPSSSSRQSAFGCALLMSPRPKIPNDLLWRNFPSRSTFDFFNNICQKRKSPALLHVDAGRRPSDLCGPHTKKGRGPLNQPKGRHCADRVRRDYVEGDQSESP